jgi:hypothetical protein
MLLLAALPRVGRRSLNEGRSQSDDWERDNLLKAFSRLALTLS